MSVLEANGRAELRGGIGSGYIANLPVPVKRPPRPPRRTPQDAADELVFRYGRNVTEWANWPALLAAYGLIPTDVTRDMIRVADRKAAERVAAGERPAPLREEPPAVQHTNGDSYPLSPGEGKEALLQWAEEVKDMARRRGRRLLDSEILRICSSVDRPLFGELFQTELQKEQTTSASRASTVPKPLLLNVPEGTAPRELRGKEARKAAMLSLITKDIPYNGAEIKRALGLTHGCALLRELETEGKIALVKGGWILS